MRICEINKSRARVRVSYRAQSFQSPILKESEMIVGGAEVVKGLIECGSMSNFV